MKTKLLFVLLFVTVSVYGQSYSGGAGTGVSPYQINTASDLIYLSTHSADWDKYFIQTADIEFNADETLVDWDGNGSADGSGTSGFSPIGSTPAFTGSYDGDGRKITNLYINRSEQDHIGLFGYVDNGDINDLGLEDIQITGRVRTGSIAAYLNNFATITNCYATGTVTGTREVGGIAAFVQNSSSINTTYANVNVSSSDNYGGGFVGYNNLGAISNCYSHGSVTRTDGNYVLFGGFTGAMNGGSITNSYSTGKVYQAPGVIWNVESLKNKGFVGYHYAGTYSNNYFDSDLSGQIYDNPSSPTTISATSSNSVLMKMQSTFTNAGWDFFGESANGSNDYWTINEGTSYPFFTIHDIPVVSTSSASDISKNSVTGNGEITDLGGANPTAHGFCWSTSSNPSLSDNVNDLGAASATGTFTATLSSLNEGTTYYYRAYATNSRGTGYGSVLSFTTSVDAPTTQANTITFSSVDWDRMTISWTRGNGSSCVVFAKQTTSGTTSPVNGTNYTANTVFANGTEISSGWFCVYNGTSNSVTVTGLSGSSDYTFQVFEYNGTGGGSTYLTSSTTDNPKTQSTTAVTTPGTQASNLVFSSVMSTTMTVSWTSGDGFKRAVFIKQANTGTALPVNHTTYNASTSFGAGDQISSTGWYCIYNGTGSSVNISGLTSGTDYRVQVFEYNGTAGAEDYLTSTATNNPNTQTTDTYTNHALSFDGNGDYASINQSTWSNTEPRSVEAWIYIPAYRSGEMNIVGWGGDGDHAVEFRIQDGSHKLQLGLWNGSSWQPTTSSSTVSTGVWTHVAAVKSGTNVTLYINGTVAGNNSSAIEVLPTINNTTIGNLIKSSTNQGLYFQGTIDEVRIWNTARTQEQISQNMYNELIGNESGLIAYYKMNEGSGTTLSDDQTSGTYSGSITNATWTTDAAPLGAPTTQATNITFNNTYSATMTVGWTNGNGSKRVVFAKQASTGNTAPTNGNTYTANANFAAGSQIGTTGWYCVYNGTGSEVSVSGLTANTAYIYQVFEYRGNAGGEYYLTETASNNPRSNSTNDKIPNYALSFNGTSDYVSIANSAYDNSTMSVEAWIKITGYAAHNMDIVGWGGDAHVAEFRVSGEGSNTGKLEIGAWNGSSWQPVLTSSTVPVGTWIHVAAVKNSTSVKLYINGVESATGTISNILTLSLTTIGNYRKTSETATNYFPGLMDEVRIWNTARNVDEIQGNMCKQLAGNESGLVHYYKMSNGSGTDLSDNKTSGTPYDGTITGASWAVSAIPQGDAVVYDYSSPTTLNLAATTGDDATISSVTGSPSGIQLYRIDAEPNVTTAPGNMTELSSSHYYGVMIIGGTSPTYTFTYNYDGHPGITDETKLDLASRANSSTTVWTETNATLNTNDNTLTLTGQTGTEYILGSESLGELPVEINSFSALFNDKSVNLTWQTATEVNNYGFEIERQTVETLLATSNKWEVVGFVEGHGNSNSPKDYTFTDDLLNLNFSLNYRLKQLDFNGNYKYSDEITVELGEIVKEYKLEQNYPNPFNPSTTIKYSIPVNVKSETSNVKLIVYDILGNEVATLVNEKQKTGNYEVKFNASNLASGIYLYRLQSGSFVQTRKLMLLK